MSGSALRAQLQLLADLARIVGTMRSLAYAELQRLRRLTAAQQQAEQVVLRALADGRVTATADGPPSCWLVIGSERGFCGGFNDRLLEAVPALRAKHPGAVWLVTGERLQQRAADCLPGAQGLAGSGSAEAGADCVHGWIEALLPHRQVYVLHHDEPGLVERCLLPLPALPAPSPGPAPYRPLPAAMLGPALQAEWLRVGLLGALYGSLQQENRWRLAQMQRAQDHLDESGARMRRAYFRQRQDAITSELETLMSSLSILAG